MWEYRAFRASSRKELDEQMVQIAQEGWELVTASETSYTQGDAYSGYTILWSWTTFWRRPASA